MSIEKIKELFHMYEEELINWEILDGIAPEGMVGLSLSPNLEKDEDDNDVVNVTLTIKCIGMSSEDFEKIPKYIDGWWPKTKIQKGVDLSLPSCEEIEDAVLDFLGDRFKNFPKEVEDLACAVLGTDWEVPININVAFQTVQEKELDPQTTKRISIRFMLQQSDGGGIEYKDFYPDERENIYKYMTQCIVFEPELINIDDVKILKVLIHYDGVTKVAGTPYGYELTNDGLIGFPAPIITFELNKEVDKEEFLKAIWTSSLTISTKKMKDEDLEPYYAEDHNGYTYVISEAGLKDSQNQLGTTFLTPPREYSFPNGMPENGEFSIPIIDLK